MRICTSNDTEDKMSTTKAIWLTCVLFSAVSSGKHLCMLKNDLKVTNMLPPGTATGLCVVQSVSPPSGSLRADFEGVLN